MREEQAAKALLSKALQKNTDRRIKQVRVAFGEICELDQGVIQKYWDELKVGTLLEHAELSFRLIDAEVQCMACFKKYQPVNGIIHCPNCGSFGAKILSGEEFNVEGIEMDNE